MNKRTYYDPIHQAISLDKTIPEEKMVMSLIDSASFQRLRRINFDLLSQDNVFHIFRYLEYFYTFKVGLTSISHHSYAALLHSVNEADSDLSGKSFG